jgi:catechol 2,3-dioxygenase-like lactoylglutathione lyase family enzyme
VAIEVQELDFILIPTRDLERAKGFYSGTLGLPLDVDSPRWVEVLAGGVTLAIWNPEAMGRPFAATPNPVALRVPDVPAARTELEAAGVEFDGETIDSGVCLMAPFRDPDGNQLMLHHRYAPRTR